jgi:choline dehydrogenase
MKDRDGWHDEEYDYIIVGSGAGGGTVAANLAREGYKTALLEAGGVGTTPNYEVPAFFAKATEDREIQWDYLVHHYDDPVQERRDCKATTIRGEFGVWYPRAGTLGGCTTHHALITIYPHDSDWEYIADLTGDDSWRSDRMHQYFQRIERCRYARRPKDGKPHPGGHGFTGWLPTVIAKPQLALRDWQAIRIVSAALCASVSGRFWSSAHYFWSCWRSFNGGLVEFLISFFDPNDLRTPSFEREGIFCVPFSTERGRRVSVRDLLNLTLQDYSENLDIYTNSLVTRVLFDERSIGSPEGARAIGVEFMEGPHLYSADPCFDADDPPPPLQRLRAKREVILAGGAFNSPQLLLVSGIGPREELAALDIETLVHRPGVGKNLQDRYEVGVVCQTKSDFALTRGANFRRPRIREDADPQFAKWLKGKGPYTTNGVLVCVTKKSSPALAEPDLIMFCVPGVFHGYMPGWTRNIAVEKNYFSWLVLKSHTRNRKGAVTLRSKDPRQTPRISFHYFHEGSPGYEDDIEAVADAVDFVRCINDKVAGIVAREVVPGSRAADRAALRRFVVDEAWGHHASCSNAMGRPDDPNAVVDSRFRVIGTRGLRVVDASVFPRIPGFFIVTPVFMIAEKASDVIVEDAKAASSQQRQMVDAAIEASD